MPAPVDDYRTRLKNIYGSKRWRKLRAQILRENPMCVCPECGGKRLPANTVDHKEPHRGNMVLFWDRRNLQALNKHCHDSWKQKQEGGKSYDPTKGCDTFGYPNDPAHHWYTDER